MLLFSTILFIKYEPVGYSVHQNGDRYFFIPTQSNKRNIVAPHIEVLKQANGQYAIKGTTDASLIEQVMDEMKTNGNITITNNILSAAP